MSSKTGISIFPVFALILGLGAGIGIGYVLFNHSEEYVTEEVAIEEPEWDIEAVPAYPEEPTKDMDEAASVAPGEMVPISIPKSRVVPAGMEFETELRLVQTANTQNEYTGSGSITVQPGGGAANMSMTAMGGFMNGTYEKQQSYRAIIRSEDGEEYVIDESFTVTKPVPSITSSSIQHLYWKCGNTLNIDVPAYGDLYNPTFKASAATVLKSNLDKKKVTIVPNGKSCVVSIASLMNGQQISVGRVEYKVIKPPRPEIVLLVNGKEYDGSSPISSSSSLMMQCKADYDFKSAMPKDARYEFSKVDLMAQTGSGAPVKVASYSGAGKSTLKMDLGTKLKSYESGTKLYFKVDKVYRVNFQNKKVEEKYGRAQKTIGAVLK